MTGTGAGTSSHDVTAAFWAVDQAALLAELEASVTGLSAEQAHARLLRDGPNQIPATRRARGWRLLLSQFASPIIVILMVATALSAGLGDLTDGLIILAIIAASGLLGFWQERGAGRVVDALLAQVRVECEVLRDGRELAVPTQDLVAGDVVLLAAGDVVPADCRVLQSRQLQVDESSLTGEAFPADKHPGDAAPDAAPTQRPNSVFLGSHVASGSGRVLVVRTGTRTQYGELAAELAGREVTTGFERGMTRFGVLLVRAMLALVCVILVANVVLGRPVVDSLLFSLALAVGLTPQLLPAIVAVSLASGARRMAAQSVIVKRLDAIEDFGTMSVLCTDKTGTLTVGVAGLASAENLAGQADERILELARLNAGLQRGFSNPLDKAILAGASPLDPALRLDELPYDFERKRLSVLAVVSGVPTLITKGALAAVMDACSELQMPTGRVPLAAGRADVQARFASLSAQGYRVLGLATRVMPDRTSVDPADESGLVLRGLLAFHDPPKPDAQQAVETLASLGVSVRLVTGDNRLAAQRVAAQVGLDPTALLTGADLDAMPAAQLAAQARATAVFAEVDPLHKERIIAALRASGQTVGFLGDGINDAAALHAADVGISVDTAADVAKQAAAIVLLAKDLGVVADGVRAGRRTFANTMKYVRVTISANFGNMLSMAAAALFLPFLPMLPRQILLLNFLSDIPATTIASDHVDAEQVLAPHAWDIRSLRTFMITFGLVSSGFDLLTFAVLAWGFDAHAELFRSGWFVMSMATELAAMLVLRTVRPCWRSRPATPLLAASALVGLITLWLPFGPLAGPLGLRPIPLPLLATLALLSGLYVTANELAKWATRRRGHGGNSD
ncbi:MAG: magnesium-translocating P-type ATPase [Candidatus Nanopelagicales bacterium]